MAQYTQQSNVVTRRIAGETLLIPITQVGVDLQKVYLLNETAAAVWRLLAEPQSPAALVAALAEQYDATADTIAADVRAVLDDLLARALVTAAPLAGPETSPAC